MPVSQLLTVSTTVADLSAAVAFYQDRLGLACSAERAVGDPAWKRLLGLEPIVAASAVSVFVGEQELELVAVDPPGRRYPAERASNDQWFQHVALVTTNIASVWERLRAGSPGKITDGGPQLLPPNTGSVTALKFRDTEGHPLELISFPPGIGSSIWQGGNGKGIIGYDHTAISVTDVDRSIAFYADLLGLRVAGRSFNRGIEQDRLDGLVGCEVDVVALKPAAVETPHLELLHYQAPAGRALTSEVRADDAASTRQVHKVDDLDALVKQLEAKARFVSPGIVTLKSGERAAAIRDPDEHMIVLMGD